MNKKTLVIAFIVIAAAIIAGLSAVIAYRTGAKPPASPSTNATNTPAANLPPLGSDRDEHGCIGSAGYSWCPLTDKCQRPWEEPCSVKASFACGQGKRIAAEFFRAPVDQVVLRLSDGREINIPRALSADGARYANADESLVFWNKGETAFMTENGTETYSGCKVNE
jgi:membrane-bound inhibitor of C-type lysozyme